MKVMLFPVKTRDTNLSINQINLENQQIASNNFEREKNKILIKNKLELVNDKDKETFYNINPVKGNGFTLNDLVMNLDAASEIITNFKEKTFSNFSSNINFYKISF